MVIQPVGILYSRTCHKTNRTVGQIVTVSAWAMIEVSVGIMCASIPAIKPLILRWAPRLLLSTGDSNSNGAVTYRNDVPGAPPRASPSSHHSRHRSRTYNGDDDFALRSIKVTKDVEFQVEEADANDFPQNQRSNGSTVPAGFGLGPPRVERHFETDSVVDVVIQRKDTHEEGGTFLNMGSPSGSRGTGANKSDESLVGRENTGAFHMTAPLPAHRP